MNLGRLKIALRGCKNVFVRIQVGKGKFMWAKGVKRHILQNLPEEITKDDQLLAEIDESNNLYIGFDGN